MIKVAYAASWFARRRFYAFSRMLYKENANWSEPPVWRGRSVISPRCNGLLRHPHALLLAMEEGKILARALTGAVGEKGYFALFDSEQNEQAVRMLLDEICLWQRKRQIREIVGPVAPGEIDMGGGVLVEGFEEAPAVNDAFNMPYYGKLLENYGMDIAAERLVYRISLERLEREKYRKIADWAIGRFGYTVRSDLSGKPRELAGAVCEIMEENAGAEEMNRMIGAVYDELIPEMCPVVFVKDEPVGVLLTIGKKENRARITTLWVKKAWRGKGVQAILFDSAAEAMGRNGMTEADASWIDVENKASRLGVEGVGGRIVRRYRLYRKEI